MKKIKVSALEKGNIVTWEKRLNLILGTFRRILTKNQNNKLEQRTPNLKDPWWS